jgi:hypothetical protein
MRRPRFTPRKIPGTRFCQRLSQLQGHNEVAIIRLIGEKSNYLIEIRTLDPPACNIALQATTLTKRSCCCMCSYCKAGSAYTGYLVCRTPIPTQDVGDN